MELIKSYIISLTNLYGVVQSDKVAEIYNSQNEDKISGISIDDDHNVHAGKIVISEEELEKCFVCIEDSCFVHEAVFEMDDGFEGLIIAKSDKPYYVPNRQKLMKYEDPYYIEKTKENAALNDYLNRRLIKDDPSLSSRLCDEIFISVQCSASMQEIFDLFNTQDIVFENLEQAQEVSQLIMELINNTRIWENNGYTPLEIGELLGTKKRENHINPSFHPSSPRLTVIKGGKKIGRNEPCPCGSGKKYKNCCLDKEK